MSRRLSRVLVALLLVWTLVPGSGEATEQVLHLLQNGHLAHSIPDDPDEEPLGTEHGCQGTMHICRCCPSSPASVLQAGLVFPPATIATPVSLPPAGHGDAHLLNVFHPPRA
jgi:hypothetical protein